MFFGVSLASLSLDGRRKLAGDAAHRQGLAANPRGATQSNPVKSHENIPDGL
jgi:hypothetical protein